MNPPTLFKPLALLNCVTLLFFTEPFRREPPKPPAVPLYVT